MKQKQATPLVLVADDEINTTIMLQHIFERDGYRVERVNDGYAAVETAKRILPDLILLDIRMPRLMALKSCVFCVKTSRPRIFRRS